MAITRQLSFSWRFALAAAICIGGLSWALLVILRGGSQPAPSIVPPSTAPQAATRHGMNLVVSTPPPSTHRLDNNEFNAAVAKTAEAIKSAFAQVQVSAPSATDAASIAREASEVANLFVSPDGERTADYLVARGDKDHKFVAMTPAERDEFLRTTAQCFAGQQPDLSKVEVRWRYIDGRVIEKPKDVGSSTPRRTFDDVMNPEKNSLTAMEVIIPIPVKTLMMGTKICRLGLLIGKSKAHPTWTTMQIRSYDIPGNAGLLFPPH
ncbi:MAG: hypothetical protein JNK16_08015 [Phycisphaerales bacterium]|nr:hypothetical protein [Phycisphaerales bacterium]